MASSTVTIDTDEWEYIDRFGIGHIVVNAQTFTLTVTDGGVSNVTYNIPEGETVTTTDGYTLYFRPEFDMNNVARTIGPVTDAGQGSDFYSVGGELVIECPVSGEKQRWVADTLNPSDADYGSAGTIAFQMRDQFGNVMSITGVTV